MLRRLPGCTCSHSTTVAAAAAAARTRYTPQQQPIASTSATILDDDEPASPFDSLLPQDRRLPLARSGGKNRNDSKSNIRLQVQRRIPRLYSPTTPPTARPPRVAARSNVSPYLPLVTRERSYLLANLRACLYSAHRDDSYQGDPTTTWQALAGVLQYPDVLPHLPPSQHSTTTRSSDPEDPHAPLEPRPRIQVSVLELRRCFTVFASEQPRTRNGLQRLLVVAELLAQKARGPKLEGLSFRGVEGEHGASVELRGGGAGLREQDWRALILFVGGHLRAPRTSPEVENAFSLFSHFTRVQEQKRPAGGNEGDFVAETATYNALLHVATRARSWDLVDQVEMRMSALGIVADPQTMGVRMQKDHFRGTHIETIWAGFEQGVRRWGEGNGMNRLWGMMLWVYAERGMLVEARKVYEAMRAGEEVDLASLRPPDHLLREVDDLASHAVRPPAPDETIYARLIQAYAFRGDLYAALSILRDMVRPPPPSASSTPTRLTAYQPTMHIYTCLFRGFATHGHLPSSPLPDVSPHLLRGPTTSRANARALRETSFVPLTKLGSSSGGGSQAVGVGLGAGGGNSPWTLDTLHTLFTSFLALSPPPPPITPTLPFRGVRTAPSSKELYWLLLAFEVLSGDDSELVLRVWDEVEYKFKRSTKARQKQVWSGWRVDKRVAGMVARHRGRVEEWRSEAEGVE